MSALMAVQVFGLALLLDVTVGDPPNSLHPVAWMGRYIAWARRRVAVTSNWLRFLLGVVVLALGIAIVLVIALLIQDYCRSLPWWLALMLQAVLFKCTFSVRALARAARRVQEALSQDNVPEARHQVAYHLVSRDVSHANATELSAATIESVAENTSDSVVAPWFYFIIAGLPGALVYRFVNTCDAMLGYRTPELEWFGKPAARLDDLLNLIPSRLTALLMLVGYGCAVGRLRAGLAIWWRDRKITASPNAGQPMSVAAGVLGVALEKPDHYVLGRGLALPSSQTILAAQRLLWSTVLLGAVGVVACLVVRGVL